MAIPAEREELENLEKTFAGNLDALRAVDSDLADRLAACDLPDDLEHTDTFDGQQSFRSASLSRSGWFGQTSMPSLRDQIVIDRFDHAGSNVILPGCGQGTGIKLLLDRLAQHNTVYVYEPTPLNLALLLRLHDLAHAIRIHRLVLLCDETLDKPLLDVLARYPLLTAPAKMLSWPWLTDEQTQKLSSQVGKTLDTIASDVKDRLDHAKKRLADMPIEPPPTDGPARVFICSLTAKPAADQFAKDLAAGLNNPGQSPISVSYLSLQTENPTAIRPCPYLRVYPKTTPHLDATSGCDPHCTRPSE